jgi:hypothetical protein
MKIMAMMGMMMLIMNKEIMVAMLWTWILTEMMGMQHLIIMIKMVQMEIMEEMGCKRNLSIFMQFRLGNECQAYTSR